MNPYYKVGTTNNMVVKSFSGQYGTSPAALVDPPPLPTRPPPEKREIGQPNAKFGKKTDSVSSSATSGW
jgi:hypothetical protein